MNDHQTRPQWLSLVPIVSEFLIICHEKLKTKAYFLSDFDFPVILRPGGEQVSNPGHDSLSLQRYSLHPATRFVAVSQARPDEGKCLNGCLKVCC